MMDPTQPAAASAPAAAQPGAEQQAPAICIQMQPDGTYSVYSSTQGPDAGQSAKDIDSALQLVKQMLSDPDADGDDDTGEAPGADNDAEALFQSGFKGARGTPLRG